jgi:hypothetical protein
MQFYLRPKQNRRRLWADFHETHKWEQLCVRIIYTEFHTIL